MMNEGLISQTSLLTSAKVLRSGERPEYLATAYGLSSAAGLTGQRRALLLDPDVRDWTEEDTLANRYFSGVDAPRNRRQKLRGMVRDGLLEERRDFLRGEILVLAPTNAGGRMLNMDRVVPPSSAALRHHLLAVEAALKISREFREAHEGASIAAYEWDELLRSRSRQGINFAARRGESVDVLADGLLWMRACDGSRVCIPIEILTSDYNDATLIHKATSLPPDTRFYVETDNMVERALAVAGIRAEQIA